MVPSLYRIPHPVLGWALSPNASYLNPLPEAVVRVSFNSSGWRDVERTMVKPAGVFRIVVLGDSFMEGYSVNLEDAFHRRLEDFTNATGRRVEVLNFGVGGYGTLQEYLVFRDTGIRYNPDLVLLGFCVANDVRNNSRELEYKLGPLMIEQRSRPFLDDASEPWRIAKVDIKAARRRFEAALAEKSSVLSQLSDRFYLLRLGRRAISRLSRTWAGPGGDERKVGPVPEDLDLAVNGVHYCEETPAYSRAWAITEKILERLKAEVEAAGATLVVFSEPTYRESSEDDMRRAERSSPDPSRLCLAKAPGFLRLGSILERQGIPFIDLLPEFRRLLTQGETLFRLSDRHWNDRGHALAADLVQAELNRRGLLPEASP